MLALDEDKAAAIDAGEQGVRVSLHRTFQPNQWNTLVLPFAMTQPQVLATFGADAEVATMTAADADAVAFATTTDGIEANTPVLLRTATTQTDYLFNGVDVVSAEPAQRIGGVTFRGNYDGPRAVGAGRYFIYNDKMMRSSDQTTMRSFRAFFEVDDAAAVKPTFGLVVDGHVTHIALLNPEDGNHGSAVANVYDLSGRRIATHASTKGVLNRGVYIVDEKKVLIK